MEENKVEKENSVKVTTIKVKTSSEGTDLTYWQRIKQGKITWRMVVIWAVSFVCLLVVGFGTTAGVMAATKRDYSVNVDLSKVAWLEYENEKHSKLLQDFDEPKHVEPIGEIVRLLNESGKTNALANFFRKDEIQNSVQANDTSISHTSNFRNAFAGKYITIRFTKPQYALNTISTGTPVKYELGLANAGSTRTVWNIMIPLNNVSDKFQAQTWYLVVSSSLVNTQSIAATISTYGNYSKLWEYVNGLEVYP